MTIRPESPDGFYIHWRAPVEISAVANQGYNFLYCGRYHDWLPGTGHISWIPGERVESRTYLHVGLNGRPPQMEPLFHPGLPVFSIDGDGYAHGGQYS